MSFLSRKIILVASQSDVTKRMTSAGYAALRKIGAKKPFKLNFRGSFAFIGYSGRGRPSYVQQVIMLLSMLLWDNLSILFNPVLFIVSLELEHSKRPLYHKIFRLETLARKDLAL